MSSVPYCTYLFEITEAWEILENRKKSDRIAVARSGFDDIKEVIR